MALSKTQVSQLYVSIFGRASEGAGNTYWQDSADMATAANTMLATDAAATYFGTNLDSDQAFVEHIYLNTLGKTYAQDTAGVDGWVAYLATHTRGEMVAALVYAAEQPENAGAAQDMFRNKVAVSDYCADNIETADIADLSAFTGYISGVTSDDATVTAAQASILADAPADFTLTSAADNIIGTSANDTIIGTQATYGASDLLVDGTTTDNDTLLISTTSSLAVTPTVVNIENVTLDISKVGDFSFAATNISGVKTFTFNRSDLMDGAVDGTGDVAITSAKAATFVAGTNVKDFSVGITDTKNATVAATVEASSISGDVVVTGVGAAGVTVLGAAGSDVSVTEQTTAVTGSKASVVTSGTVSITNAVDELTVSANEAATVTLSAIQTQANSGNLTIAGSAATTVKATAAILTGKEILNESTSTVNLQVTAAGVLDLTDVESVTSVILGAAFDQGVNATHIITVNSDQLITTKTNQTQILIENAVATGVGAARLAALDNEVTAAVTLGVVAFGSTNAFDSIYIDATADKLSATSFNMNDTDVILTGTKDITMGTVTDAESITSSSTGKINLTTNGNTANEQTVVLGAGNDTVVVNSGTDIFVVNLGNGDNTLTITDADEDSQFVTGTGNDDITLTDTQGALSLSTGTGDDEITLGALTNVTDLTLNAGTGTDTLVVSTTVDVSASDSTFVGIEELSIATGVTLTVGYDQFTTLAAFELQGAGTFAVDASAETDDITLDASVVTLGFGTTAVVTLEAGAGDDTLEGTVGGDTFDGNAGDDTFVFTAGSGNTTTLLDVISDFVTDADMIKTGTAGSATNFSADTTTRATLAAAATAADGLMDGTIKYVYTDDVTAQAADSFLFIDWDLDGDADQVITLTGLGAGDLVYADIIA